MNTFANLIKFNKITFAEPHGVYQPKDMFDEEFFPEVLVLVDKKPFIIKPALAEDSIQASIFAEKSGIKLVTESSQIPWGEVTVTTVNISGDFMQIVFIHNNKRFMMAISNVEELQDSPKSEKEPEQETQVLQLDNMAKYREDLFNLVRYGADIDFILRTPEIQDTRDIANKLREKHCLSEGYIGNNALRKRVLESLTALHKLGLITRSPHGRSYIWTDVDEEKLQERLQSFVKVRQIQEQLEKAQQTFKF